MQPTQKIVANTAAAFAALIMIPIHPINLLPSSSALLPIRQHIQAQNKLIRMPIINPLSKRDLLTLPVTHTAGVNLTY